MEPNPHFAHREIAGQLSKEQLACYTATGSDHRALFAGITECLLFSSEQYVRTDMSFLLNISTLDYGRRFRVLLIGDKNDPQPEKYKKIAETLREKYGILLLTFWEGLILCILPEKYSDVSVILDIYHYLEERYGRIRAAGSVLMDRLEDCRNGLQEATRTYDMIQMIRQDQEQLLFYEDLGIWRLLYDLNDASMFESYCNSVFQDIWEFDRNNDGHLFETLECYFENNCDKSLVSKKLFIHENTLRYRLHQIEDILQKDLKDVNVIADIVTALKTRRMIQILDET